MLQIVGVDLEIMMDEITFQVLLPAKVPSGYEDRTTFHRLEHDAKMGERSSC